MYIQKKKSMGIKRRSSECVSFVLYMLITVKS